MTEVEPPRQHVDPQASRRLLVVEDEPAVANVLRELLGRSLQCKVDLALNGFDALYRLKTQTYDLIIADVQMPGMDGMELFRTLREQFPELLRRYIVTTGYAGDYEIVEELAASGVPIVPKPFSITRLAAACAPLLEATN